MASPVSCKLDAEFEFNLFKMYSIIYYLLAELKHRNIIPICKNMKNDNVTFF